MRKWYKYLLTCDTARYNKYGNPPEKKNPDNREDFFRTYFAHGPHSVRFRHYHNFLQRHLSKEEKILSVGSGNCVNEVLLMEQGFNIICSDIEQPDRKETFKLFPHIRFVRHNIKTHSFIYRFDCIISLSLLYLFNEQELPQVFQNMADSLEPGGRLIFDFGAAEDNVFTYLLDEGICKLEMGSRQLLHYVTGRKRNTLFKKHHGYRTKNKEVISIAEEAGFVLQSLTTADYLTELKRSNIFNKLGEKTLGRMGKFVPYVRMFVFAKKD